MLQKRCKKLLERLRKKRDKAELEIKNPEQPIIPEDNLKLERKFYEWSIYQSEVHNLVVQEARKLEQKRNMGKEYTV